MKQVEATNIERASKKSCFYISHHEQHDHDHHLKVWESIDRITGSEIQYRRHQRKLRGSGGKKFSAKYHHNPILVLIISLVITFVIINTIITILISSAHWCLLCEWVHLSEFTPRNVSPNCLFTPTPFRHPWWWGRWSGFVWGLSFLVSQNCLCDLCINIATGEMSQAITPFHFFDNSNFHH